MAEKLSKRILRAVKGKGGDAVLEALSLPQRILMEKAAKVAGVPAGETSEESAFNIVDGLAKRAKLPEDNTFVNALKAGAVAGLETFGDPLGPIGKLGKYEKVARIMKKQKLSKGSSIFKKAQPKPTTLGMKQRGSGEFVKDKNLEAVQRTMRQSAERKAAGLPTAVVDQPIASSQRLANRPATQLGSDPGAAERLAKSFRGE